ncbi:hypothetical protein ACFQ0F_05825 [Paraperlucidibaca wandonensis]|uniref:Lipoprotein n=1 Tax=Paraperlucidibaca wandonensis TaxID=1268273 RepID=A0ABW3HFB8_9GAMM
MKKLTFLFVLIFALIGCSDKPSDNEIEEQIVGNLLSNGGDEIFRIENFEKTNGFEKDSKTYIADVKYELVFKKSLHEVAQQLKQESQESPFGRMGAELGVMALKMQFGSFEAGHKVSKEEKISFNKTENGWQVAE